MRIFPFFFKCNKCVSFSRIKPPTMTIGSYFEADHKMWRKDKITKKMVSEWLDKFCDANYFSWNLLQITESIYTTSCMESGRLYEILFAWHRYIIVAQWRHIETYILVNIGSGNGLLLDATKPFPEQMLTYHQKVFFCIDLTATLQEMLTILIYKMSFTISVLNCVHIAQRMSLKYHR